MAIETKRKWIVGDATDEDLAAAESAAWSAARLSFIDKIKIILSGDN